MSEDNKMGINRTGMDMSPMHSPLMIEVANIIPTDVEGGVEALATCRNAYIANAGLLGSVPLPGTLRGVATVTVQKLKGNRPSLLIDRLGERLAFERTGARLYQLFINKCNALPAESAGISLEALGRIHRDELVHFSLLVDVVRSLGADPSSETPGADASGVMASGLLQVLSDPRTTVSQGLDAIMMAELSDNECWETLIQITEEAELTALTEAFQLALSDERRHLNELRGFKSRLLFGAPDAH